MDITALVPITEVHLLKDVPLDNTYNHTRLFADKTAQFTYFSSKKKAGCSFTDLTPVNLNNAIKLNINAYTIFDCNYMMFKNANFSSKWLYAFITDIQYISVNCCSISFELDLMQTWHFDYSIKESFVVREHVEDDAIGKHLVDEGIDTGEYKYKFMNGSHELGALWYVVAYSDDGINPVYGGKYGGLYSGLRYRPFRNTDIDSLNTFLASLDSANLGAAVSLIFTIPELFLPADVISGIDLSYNFEGRYKEHITTFYTNNLDGYVPKNKKLFTYPYTFLYVSNNKGSATTYRGENFGTAQPLDNGKGVAFLIGGNLAPNPIGFCMPKNYKNVEFCFEEQLTLDGFPLCSWKSDVYANWLAQNSMPIAIGTATNAITAIGGAVTGNIPAAISGISGVLSQISAINVQSKQPDVAKGNIVAGSLNCATGNMDFFIGQMEIKREFAERIDKFFSMYGYKVNQIKIPNLHSRSSWNYIQLMNANLIGSIPFNDISKIRSIYEKGITFWHVSNVGNYSLDNSII